MRRKLVAENRASGWVVTVYFGGRSTPERLSSTPPDTEMGKILDRLADALTAGHKDYPKGIKVGSKIEIKLQ